MFEEIKTIDQITATENGTILVREATRILKDGQQIAQTFHRWSFAPGSDLTGMPENVVAIANTVWTPEVIKSYKEQLLKAVTI